MARNSYWAIIPLLHWPFCLYLSVIASTVSMYDEFDPNEGGVPAASTDDANEAIQVSIFVCVIAAVFGTITDLADLVITLITSSSARTTRKFSHCTPGWARSPKGGYLIVSLRFIMICFWVAVLAWGLVPTDVLMYIDIDPADDLGDGDPPNYSDSVIAIISLVLVLDFVSFASPLIQRCALCLSPGLRARAAKMEEGAQPADSHREINSLKLEQPKSVASTPIGHTRAVEYV